MLTLVSWDGPCVVCSEGWPSWAFALSNLGCIELVTYARFGALARAEFRDSPLGSKYCHSVSNIFTFCSGKPPPLVFLQGSSSFIGDLLARLSPQLPSARFTAIISTSAVPLDGDHKFKTKDLISHFHVGGITDGSWWYHDSDLPALVPSSAHKDVQRSLIGCLRST